MTDKHPTNALPMPNPAVAFDTDYYEGLIRIDSPKERYYEYYYFTEDQLRAERIAAYDKGLKDGRESMREEAAKKYPSIARQIRSIEL